MTVEEALAAIPKVQQQAGTDVVVVKAQIHAGGRGKGGGVKVAKTKADAEDAVKKIFGMQLVTPQTGPEGKKVQRLLVEQGLAIEHEYYLGMLLDRATGRVTVMASTEAAWTSRRSRPRTPTRSSRSRSIRRPAGRTGSRAAWPSGSGSPARRPSRSPRSCSR